MIDATKSKCIEREINELIKITLNDEITIKIQNYDEYYKAEGHNSFLNYNNSPIELMRQHASRCGLSVISVETDYNIIKLRCKIRKPQEVKRKTSIVMSSYGHPKECKQAILSIREHTHVPYELIVVNNPHPKDDPIKMLTALQEDHKVEKIAFNTKNRGDMGALNIGIKMADGEDICVVNNDIIATDGWLDAMQQCLHQEPGAVIAAPRTNKIAGHQVVMGAPSNEMVDMSMPTLTAYAKEWRDQHGLGWWKASRIRSFAMLMHGDLIKEVGGLDERYGMGNYDDDDMCMEALTRGMGVYVVDDSYVHHYCSLSFNESPAAFGISLAINKGKFLEKWQTHEKVLELMMANDRPREMCKQDMITWRLQ